MMVSNKELISEYWSAPVYAAFQNLCHIVGLFSFPLILFFNPLFVKMSPNT